MKRSVHILSVAVVVAALGSVAMAVGIETVPVGNIGNSADITGYGAVDYEYNIGKYEVTAGQYTEFLNAVAASDTYELYNASMWSGAYPCKIQRSGSLGSRTYSVASDWANRPVNFVSWGDAARFANWLHNGQPAGAQNDSTTEDGSYYLNGATSRAALVAVTRKAGATWVIPAENEWYKAAYHKNDGATGNYFYYPTSSNDLPSNLLDFGGNNATFHNEVNLETIGSPYHRTEVGAHKNSASPYGTFDQAANVWEWNETSFYGTSHGTRGGSFGAIAIRFSSTYHSDSYPLYSQPGDAFTGFRLSEISTPLRSVSAMHIAAEFTPGGGDYGLGEITAVGQADVVVEDVNDQATTYAGGSFEMTASLLADNSVGGSAAGEFRGGALSFRYSGGADLLTGDLIELMLYEVGDDRGMLAGNGLFAVTGGSLQERFTETHGEIFQMFFQITPSGIDDFSAAFTGFTDITITPVPEPATMSLLALLALSLPKRGGLAVLRRRKK